MEIYYIERKSGEKQKEIVAGNKYLKWVYDTKPGNILLENLVKKKLFSSIYGKLQDKPSSRKKIKDFVNNLNIDMAEAKREFIADYNSFNDFFTRKLKKEARPISSEKEELISPADGRVYAYENIDKDEVIQVKGSHYTLKEFLQDENLANEYDKGTCIIVRLCPSDYHRFHFPDSGTPSDVKRIKGKYYSVNPIALKKVIGLYCQNKREITEFKSDNFGEIIYSMVGATCVGSIIQTYKAGKKVAKGDEKGYFKFGGSTVILFFKEGQVKVDTDILENTKLALETKVDMGEAIGRRG